MVISSKDFFLLNIPIALFVLKLIKFFNNKFILQKKSPKPRTLEKTKTKSQIAQKCNWFQHLHTEHDKAALKQVAINSK